MPKYFFNTKTGDQIDDEDGVELPSPNAALQMATRHAAELMREGGAVFWLTSPWKVTVTDETGFILLVVDMDCHFAPAFNPRVAQGLGPLLA